jgi:membrane-associated protease RseP (regulator of RpoE activity)
MGAVIKLQSEVPSRRILFDIGAAGPLAGFVVSTGFLVYGFSHLPPIEFLYTIHPEYANLPAIPEGGPNALTFGSTILYSLIAQLVAPEGAFVPPMGEIYHYPFLCVGWFGLFVTAMNLIPVGQLDGGHISASMFGNRHRAIEHVALIALVVLGLAGFLPLVGIDFFHGWTGWLFWAFILIFFIRATRQRRTTLEETPPLDPLRRTLGWICVGVFVGSFSLTPFTIQLP